MESMIRYFGRCLRSRKGQAGFTLIELLVVVTILGVLAAIVTLSLVGLTTNAQAKACEQEYKTVQAGLDAYMANNNIDTVPETDQTTGTADMTIPVKLYNKTPSATSPTYLRNSPTQWAYVWDSTGRITSIVQVPNGPVKPDACVVSGG